jgi:hypothetical protein
LSLLIDWRRRFMTSARACRTSQPLGEKGAWFATGRLCRTCGKPVVEIAGFGPFKVMFIPASNFEPAARLPPVRFDMFYHRRVLDMKASPQ